MGLFDWLTLDQIRARNSDNPAELPLDIQNRDLNTSTSLVRTYKNEVIARGWHMKATRVQHKRDENERPQSAMQKRSSASTCCRLGGIHLVVLG